MASEITAIVNEILDRFGEDILLDGGRFCALLDDMAPNLAERKAFRNMQRLGVWEKACRILREDDSPARNGKIMLLMKHESLPEEWGRMALEAFSCAVEPQYGLAPTGYEKEWKLAHQGEAEAQYAVGVCYYWGRGVPQDHPEAAKWYRKAAEQGYDAAQLDLGCCYLNGVGVQQDPTEAAKWLRAAAEQGNRGAQIVLVDGYSTGFGLPRNYAEAEKWRRKLREQGT